MSYNALMKIYHASCNDILTFHQRPTWFSMNEKDARGWHNVVADSITYICEYVGARIATEEQWAEIAKEVWPESEPLYSMFDKNIGEYEDIDKFLWLMKKSGFGGAYIQDYDPADFEKGHSRSLCVFDPFMDVKILEILK